MKRWLLIISLLFLAPLSRGQNPTLQGWCEAGAQPVVTSGLTSSTQVQQSFPACTVTVFVHGGGLATIFSDASNTPLSNPFTAQSNGRWLFYVAAGRYDIQLSGAGFPSPVTYLDVPTATGGVGTSPGGSPIQTQVNNSGSFGGTPCQSFSNISTGPINLGCNVSQPLSANVSLKHLQNNVVQYVSTFGSDANDGLSWGTAKKTIFAALEALPGGSSSAPATAGKGTIYVTDGGGTCAGLSSDGVTNNGVIAGFANPFSPSGTGIWIMGPSDPNYASPPTGWLHFSGPFSVIGVSGICNQGQSRQAMEVDVAAGAIGSNEAAGHPGIWISGISGTLRFENLSLEPAWNAIQLGIDSNGSRTTTGAQGITFKNVTGSVFNSNASAGPTVDIGRNVFWVWFEGCTFSANVAATPITADNHSNIVVNGAGLPSFLLTIKDNVWSGGGGLKVYTSGGGTTVDVDNLTIEGAAGHSQPAVWLPTTGDNATSMFVNLNHVFLADTTDVIPAVEIDGTTSPAAVLVRDASGGAGPAVVGPATVLGLGGIQGTSTQTQSPALFNQAGFLSGATSSLARVYGQQDTLRRSFSPVLARFAQKALQLPSAWTTGTGTSTLTQNIGAPDGTTNAGRIVGVSGCVPQCSLFAYHNAAQPTAANDWVVAGVWARSNSVNGFATGAPAAINVSSMTGYQIAGNQAPASGTTNILLQHFIQGDGEWQWYWAAFKIITVNNGTGTLNFQLFTDTTHTVDFYAPVLLYIPAGTVSDNEVAEMAMHLVTYPETAGPAEVSMLRNQYLRLGSTAFANLGTPANGVFIYCSDCTVANPCAGSGTGALAKRLNGVWVCN